MESAPDEDIWGPVKRGIYQACVSQAVQQIGERHAVASQIHSSFPVASCDKDRRPKGPGAKDWDYDSLFIKSDNLKKGLLPTKMDDGRQGRAFCSPTMGMDGAGPMMMSSEDVQREQNTMKNMPPKVSMDDGRQGRAFCTPTMSMDGAGAMMMSNDDIQQRDQNSLFHQENALVKEIIRNEKEERAMKYTFPHDGALQFGEDGKELWAQRFGVTSLRKDDGKQLVPQQPQFPAGPMFREDGRLDAEAMDQGPANLQQVSGDKQVNNVAKSFMEAAKQTDKFMPQGTFGFQARQPASSATSEPSFQSSLYSFTQADFNPRNSQNLRDQVFSLSDGDKLACSVCGFVCKNPKTLKKHMQNHTKERPYLCTTCNGSFLSSYDLKRHLIVHASGSDDKPFSCSLCEFECKRKEHILEHMKNKHAEKGYTCSFCDFSTSFADGLKQHLLTHVHEKLFACPLCRFKGTSAHQLRCHMISHARDKPFACSFCENEYESSTELQAHLITHSRDKPFACSQCDFTCKNSSELKQHKIMEHSEGRTFSCFICEFTCTNIPSLKQHMSVHQTDSSFSCFLCSFTCRSPFFLTKHINRCHPQGKQFICSFCDFTSPESDALRAHIQECHSGDKKYLCTICGAYSKTSDHLKKHMMTHWEDKPFACDLCDYTCNRSESLKRHMSCHSQERPYPCSLCEYSSKTPHGLKSHMLLHTPEKHLACPLCDYMCKRPDVLRRHMKVHIKKIKRVKSEKLGFTYTANAQPFDL